MPAVAFLHTSNRHVPTFRALVADRAPDLAVLDVVDETLLADALARGVDDDVRAGLQGHLAGLRRSIASPIWGSRCCAARRRP